MFKQKRAEFKSPCCMFCKSIQTILHLHSFVADPLHLHQDGCTSFDIALEVGRRIKSLQVVNCETSSEKDKKLVWNKHRLDLFLDPPIPPPMPF